MLDTGSKGSVLRNCADEANCITRFFVFMVNVRREKARESCVTNLKMSRNVSVNR